MHRLTIVWLLFLWSFGLSAMAQINYSWDTFKPENSNLPAAQVTQLAKSQGDTLWIGTSNGLAFLVDSTIQDIAASSGWFVTALEIDPQGRLWVGTSSQGAFRRNIDGSFSEFSSNTLGGPGGFNHNHILSFAFDNNLVWIGTSGGGLYRYDGITWQLFNNQTTNGLLPFSDIPDLEMDEAGDLWIATSSAGLYAFKSNGTTFYFNTDSGLTHQHVQRLALDGNAWMWLGFAGQTGSDHLMRFNRQNSQFEIFNQNNSGLTHTNIWDIQQDSLGRFWFASNGSGYGLAYYDSLGFHAQSAFQNQSITDLVYALAPADSDFVFVGHFMGLSINRDQPGVGMASLEASSQGLIFPNPAKDWISTKKAQLQTAAWSMVSLNGQIVKTGHGFPISVVDLEPGPYLLHISPKNAPESWHRLIRTW